MPTISCGSSTTQIDFRIASGIAAELAHFAVADVVADAAEPELVLDVQNGLRQLLGVVAAAAQDMKREALRGLLPDAGQALELGNQAGKRFGEIRHRLQQTRRQAHAAQHAAHFAVVSPSTFLTASLQAARTMSCKHFDVTGHFGIDLHAQQVLLAVHFDGDHAAAGRGLDANQGDLLLHALLHLLRLRIMACIFPGIFIASTP